MPTPTAFEKIDKTIIVKEGEVFDGNGKQFDFRKSGMCQGQKETSSGMIFKVFLVMPGATLKNVIIGPNQAEGVHCPKGSCTIDNVWWVDVCEDALSIKGENAQGSRVLGGGAQNAQDKVIQHNGKGSVTIDGFVTRNVGKLYRSCGTCGPIRRTVALRNVKAEGKALTLAGINRQNGDVASFQGKIEVSPQVKNVCEVFERKGNKGKPKKVATGAGNGCNFATAQVRRLSV
ncbi:pectate lyase [Catenaria anguillulae PL171]|uniref:Pectate lyase n=1 Tax=Catenaria anguillulae PL171 TaxID=765915 RepID=A0A1Y2HND7_9FUNG|nr:pectate lyase [Catenaria anguillulae PL171]